jgi:1-deoxy-D-xylulose-5-phosphate reductoisomerase
VAVAAFLEEKIGFDHISTIISKVLVETRTRKIESIKEVLEADAEARQMAREHVERLSSNFPLPHTASATWHGE